MVLPKALNVELKHLLVISGHRSKTFIKYYGGYKGNPTFVRGIAIFPIHCVNTSPPLCFSQDVCNYTLKGRMKIHANLKKIDKNILIHIMNNPVPTMSEEFNDNRISLYVAQNGKCSVSGKPLQIGEMDVHHKVMQQNGGTDKYQNLTFITTTIHKLIHITDIDKINGYLKEEKLNAEQMKKLNELRKLVGNYELI